ncbi:Sphingoid long-chain base transporter RSB1 [Trichoderma ghanense]|uniref:Sphingoid long-chain base transporter RSB1 n=1 Tax=Trichoderma ghanense TaxID=65468 RepID=A0ABY2H9U7_9HYPO
MNATTNTTSQVPPNGIGALSFTPLLAPNALFVATFTILLLIHIFLSLRFPKFYGYAIGMLGGLLLELLGYIAKVQLSHSRANKNGYIMYIIGLTLGPTFLSSSLYLCISTLQRHHPAARLKHITPKIFSALFILGDFICLCFIGCGGSLAAIFASSPVGVDLMIAGLGTQVLVTAVFCVLLAVVCKRTYRHLRKDRKVGYIGCAAVAAVCLFIRSCWRVAELNGGFNGPLSSAEGVFIALDSVPMIVMCILLTIMHPEFWFDRRRLLVEKAMSSGFEVGGKS